MTIFFGEFKHDPILSPKNQYMEPLNFTHIISQLPEKIVLNIGTIIVSNHALFFFI
jgi:hypothetical protein